MSRSWWPALLILLPGGCLVAAQVWWRRRCVANEKPLIIPAPRQIFTGHDDSLRLNAEARRAIANDRRRQARSIESGKPVESKIRIVGHR